jgi:hypothetical protein
MILNSGKPKYWERNFSKYCFVHTNLIWTDLGLNANLCGARPGINHLNHGTACFLTKTLGGSDALRVK